MSTRRNIFDKSCSMVALEIKDKKLISTVVFGPSGAFFQCPWTEAEMASPALAIHALLTDGWNLATWCEKTSWFDSPISAYCFTRRDQEIKQ